MVFKNIRITFFAFLIIMFGFKCGFSNDYLSDFVIIVQPIIVCDNDGMGPPSFAIPEDLIDRAYRNADIDFYFLEPLYFNNTAARDGLINLDSICVLAEESGFIKGTGDIVNMFFVNAVDGHIGPLGRGMFNGNITFIALGKESHPNLEAFVIGHEVAHNLSLKHIVDDPNIPDSIPNLLGDGLYSERIDPKFSLVQCQINQIMKSPLVNRRIDLVNVERAKKIILDESFEVFYKNLQLKEISAFTGLNVLNINRSEARKIAKNEFSNAVLEFSHVEQKAIEWLVDHVDSALIHHQLAFVAHHPWRFIKVKSSLCGGFAYTMGTSIVLSENHLNYLAKTWSEKMADSTSLKLISRLGSLIVHEQLHAIQRTFPSKFDRLYQDYWGFLKKNVDIDGYDLLITNQLSNPDAPNANYLIPDSKDTSTFCWVRTILKETQGIPIMGTDFTDRVFEVAVLDGEYYLRRDSLNVPKYFNVESFMQYTNRFPITRGIDHPNEISAYMLSQVFEAKLHRETPFINASSEATETCQQFLDWADAELSKKNTLNISL